MLRFRVFARLLLLFIAIPLAELTLFIQLRKVIGLGPTIAIVIFTAFLGAYLTKQQGLRVLQRYQETLAQGKLPTAEIMDGLMILVAGAVLLTPGFLTDTIGFLLLVPPVRLWVRQALAAYLKDRVQIVTTTTGTPGTNPSGQQAGGPGRVDTTPKPGEKSPGGVIEVETEVVDEK